ncbi:MAG: peptidoglycan-binding domain-containing protein, partial [Candidatus Taylorbacteria bacterium]|nr:peptidoglycan-binding domain-containing protein [Candidatus Taylorbacteria bacterium]
MKNHSIYIIATYALLIMAAPLIVTSVVNAQAVNCPAGYVCTLIPTVTPTVNPSVSSTMTPTGTCYTFNNDLTIGSTGPDVVALQNFLIGNGYNITNVVNGWTPKGYFGSQTAVALRQYQTAIGIPATGFFGSATRTAVSGTCSSTPSGATNQQANLLVTAVGTPTITMSNITPGASTVSVFQYTAVFNVRLTATGGDVSIGLPASSQPAIGGPYSNDFQIYKNGQPDTSTYNASVTYSQPSGTALLSNAFIVSANQNQSITMPVMITFTINNPGANTYGVRLNQVNWFTSGGKSSTLLPSADWSTAYVPGTVIPTPSSYHSADLNHDWRIDQSELDAVTALYNYRNGTTRTGEYHATAGTYYQGTDGLYEAGPGYIKVYHSADSNRDGKISLLELTRVIELKNAVGGYKVQAGTEDGFVPVTTTTQPGITSVFPNSASPGSSVVIYGNSLTSLVTNMVGICNDTSCGNYNGIVSTDGSRVTFTVPNIPVGNYNLTVIDLVALGNGTPAAFPFTVTSPTAQTNPTVSVSRSSINSGGSSEIHWTIPSDAVSAKLYISCPSGVSGKNVDSVPSNAVEECNRWANVPVSYATFKEISFTNSTSNAINVVPNFYIYRASNPNYAIGVSSQITVNPATNTRQPSITVLSPNGGETYKAGDNVLISWSTANIPTNTSVMLQLSYFTTNSQSRMEDVIISNLSANSGSFWWKIPVKYSSGYESGGFRVRAILAGSNIPGTNPPEDISDNSFAIIGSQPISVCTMDAKQCSDGSYVSRDSNNGCQFRACPVVQSVSQAYLSRNANSPISSTQLATNGQILNLPLLVFDVRAQGDNLYLNSVKANITLGGTGTLGAAYLYQGNTMIASASIYNGSAVFSNISIGTPGAGIPSNQTVPYTLKADVTGIANNSITISANIVSDSSTAVRNSSNTAVSVSGSAYGNTMTVMNQPTQPTIQSCSGNIPIGASVTKGPGSYTTGSGVTTVWTYTTSNPNICQWTCASGYTYSGGNACILPVTAPTSYHSADTNHDSRIDDAELARFQTLYNYRNETSRTGEYHSQGGTVDGYEAGPGAISTYHSADTDRNGRLSLMELSRVIELKNAAGGYKNQSGTEDGFAPISATSDAGGSPYSAAIMEAINEWYAAHQ